MPDTPITSAARPRHREGCPGGGFHFGPCWTVGTGCCGKPVGCSVTDSHCRNLNHPWKRKVHGTGGRPKQLDCLRCEAVVENTAEAVTEHRRECKADA